MGIHWTGRYLVSQGIDGGAGLKDGAGVGGGGEDGDVCCVDIHLS